LVIIIAITGKVAHPRYAIRAQLFPLPSRHHAGTKTSRIFAASLFVQGFHPMSTWQCIAPIVHYVGLNRYSLPLDLGNRVMLTSLLDWLTDGDALDLLNQSKRDKIRNFSDLALSVHYDASNVNEPDPSWRGIGPRSVQESAHELLIFTNLSLWLSQPSPLSIDAIFHFDQSKDATNLRHVVSFSPVRPHPKDFDSRLSTKICGEHHA